MVFWGGQGDRVARVTGNYVNLYTILNLPLKYKKVGRSKYRDLSFCLTAVFNGKVRYSR
jgi:hypothetical protein